MNINQARERPIANIALIFSILAINRFFTGSFSRIILNLLIWASYSVILFFPRSWWTRTRLLVAAGIVIIESTVGLIWYREKVLLYFLAILTLAAAMHLSWARSSIPVLGTMFLMAALYVRFGHEDPFSFLSFVLLSVVFYFSIRNRMQRNELYELNKQHLSELQDAYDQLQKASMAAMQHAVLEERTRIAREIHDAVGHSLTALIIQMQALRYMVRTDPDRAEKSVEEMLLVARQGLNDIRSSVHALADNQSRLGNTSLRALLLRMEASSAIQFTFHCDFADEDVTVVDYGILYRVLQEAVTNVIRHSRATLLEVRLHRESDKIVMSIRDNGIVKSPHEISEGFGLKMMRERLQERGGRLRYSVLEPSGLSIVAEISTGDGEYPNEGAKE